MKSLDGADWCQDLEGRDQGPDDAAHWVRVYTSLLTTVVAVGMEVPEARARSEELRHRLGYWESVLKNRSGRGRRPVTVSADTPPSG